MVSSMGFWDQVIMVGMLVFVGYIISQNLKRDPAALSSANISKSFRFMGFLAVILIAFVSFLVMLLPATPAANAGATTASKTDHMNNDGPSRPNKTF